MRSLQYAKLGPGNTESFILTIVVKEYDNILDRAIYHLFKINQLFMQTSLL